MDEDSAATTAVIEYSLDKETWTTYTYGDTINLSSIGDKVYFRGDNARLSSHINHDYDECYNQYYFEMGGLIAGGGNIMSLLDKTCTQTTVPPVSFFGMFAGCHSLTSAPTLPATTLAEDCYCSMFASCHSLASAPTLPATTLTEDCYAFMFSGCTSLTSAPALPATTLVENCYDHMFGKCKSLNEVHVSFTAWTNNDIKFTISWLNLVSSTGTFYCPSGLNTTTRGISRVPKGWTVTNV